MHKSHLIVTTLCLICSIHAAPATSILDEREVKYIRGISERLSRRVNLRDSKLSEAGAFRVNFDSETGLIKQIVQIHHGRKLQAEVDLLDAIVTDTPLEASAWFEKDALDKEMVLGFSKNYLACPPLESVKSVFLHKIPLAVFDRYPGRFTFTELTDSQNLQTVDSKLIGVSFIQRIRQPWIEFFKQNKAASRAQIRAFSDALPVD
jgi:hypothetical protein